MALPATHLRFAAAIAGQLFVTDRAAYLSGTLYPDSRWLTGIDRRRTHTAACLEPDFPADDFTLGWHIHCHCDRIQQELYNGLFDGLADLTPDARWIQTSAAKVVQDMHDAAEGAINAHLSLLTEARTPNGESGQAVAAYMAAVQRTYHQVAAPAWSDYVRLWRDVGLDPHRIGQIGAQIQWIRGQAALVGDIHAVFERMMARWSAAHAADARRGCPAAVQTCGGWR